MNPTKLSDEQLAGQRLMVGFEGTRLGPELKDLISRIKVGGLILFASNLKTPDQIRDLCRAAQEQARACGQPPLFIAIDQEGGPVARLKEPFTQFPGNPAMKSVSDAVHFARVTAAELVGIGVNMNMAPVLDVAPAEINSVMAARAFGHDPKWVARLGTAVIRHFQQARIMAVAKHFPGIGRTVLDSHRVRPHLDVAPAAVEAFDLPPFKVAIEHGVDGVMLSHIVYEKIDPHWPASLSPRIAKTLLRDQMGFGGMAVTDDLDMGAIEKNYDIQTAIRQILAADIDMALICHSGPKIETAFAEILKGLADHPALKAGAVAAVNRIIGLKRKYAALS